MANIKEIKERLIAGNRKYCGIPFATLDTNEELRNYLCKNGQHPEIAVVACSDSRVNVEALFSAGLGELFVIRSAGGAILDGELSSIAYALHHLHCSYLLLLGHTHCGAVDSVIKGCKEALLQPLLDYVALGVDGEKDARQAEKNNVLYSVAKMRELFPEATVEGAIYDIVSGAVTFLE